MTSSGLLPPEETTSKQSHGFKYLPPPMGDSHADFFSHSFSPEPPPAHAVSPPGGLVGISEGTNWGS